MNTIVSKTSSTFPYTSLSHTGMSAPFAPAFLLASSTALGFTSTAVTSQPFFAQWMDTTPEPHPTSRTFSPGTTSRDSIRRMLSSDGG